MSRSAGPLHDRWARRRRWRRWSKRSAWRCRSNAAIPAVDSRRCALAHLAGRRIVEMVREDVRMSTILTREAFENAIRVNGALGGSTNAVIHLLAIAGRVGVPLTLDDWDRLGRDVPTLVDLHAVGPVPDGGLLLRRRPAGGDARAGRARPAAPRRADGQRQDASGRTAARRPTGTPRSSGRSTTPLRRRTAASRCCAATSRPTARCSSRRRRRRA